MDRHGGIIGGSPGQCNGCRGTFIPPGWRVVADRRALATAEAR
ncbi:MAG: hypothetical protein OZSIB_4052 [Candidatus Ozemobacter sibiricus]|uniref:Uncharacterized protein n=1 Tax=Candidatus Ozemobacter sibiricus TaxID=2268124 RepID=A0A367ZAX7_9BACT|nr:MAG: hypothetical protein OZSIB_4052 [Candidatus Ozemobacter sibiricus]